MYVRKKPPFSDQKTLFFNQKRGLPIALSQKDATFCFFQPYLNPQVLVVRFCANYLVPSRTGMMDVSLRCSLVVAPIKELESTEASKANADLLFLFVSIESRYNTTASGAPGQPVYGVTGPDCPVQRDLFGEVVTAMRTKGLAVGAYYSKADWHAHTFWSPSFGFPTTPNVNYNITENSHLYEQFVAFNKAQLDEIQRMYVASPGHSLPLVAIGGAVVHMPPVHLLYFPWEKLADAWHCSFMMTK